MPAPLGAEEVVVVDFDFYRYGCGSVSESERSWEMEGWEVGRWDVFWKERRGKVEMVDEPLHKHSPSISVDG